MKSTDAPPFSSTMGEKGAVLPWVVWSLGCIFYFYETLLSVSPGVMSNELMRDFAVTSHTLGIMSGVYYYSYSFMQLPGGMLMDYFGPHRLLTIATFVCAICTIAFALTNSFFTACFARFMIGFGSAFAAVGTMKLSANWFPSSRFAFLTGLMVTIGMLGAIGGEAPLAKMVDFFGWRHSMMAMGVVGLFVALLILIIAKDAPQNTAHETHGEEKEHIFKSLLKIIKNKELWFVAVYGGLMYLSTPVFCGLWGVPFLVTKLHLTKAVAANYISLIFLGWIIASPLWGIFSGRIGLRKPPLYIGSCGALLCSLIFIYAPVHNLFFIKVALFFFGIFSAAFLPSFALAKELCNQHYVATGLSFMNMMNMIGIALIQPLIGFILDRLWQGEFVHGVRYYPVSAYQIALSILPIAIAIALALLPKIRESYCHPVGSR